jgi:hypothetical protein
MHDHDTAAGQGSGLETPIRNHYFYGQLLGVHNFELETYYTIGKDRLRNRLVLGYGVVCGLAVDVSNDGRKVAVGPGVAIDKAGREIVVARRTRWIPIPPEVIEEARERAEDDRRDACVSVLICYHECRGDPAVVHAGECGMPDPCAPSTIREQYRIEFRSRCAKRPRPSCSIAELVSSGGFNHDALARWVTYDRRCTRVPSDTCIPLANLRLADGNDHCDPGEVDIEVRPVVASNVVLTELILALLERQPYRYE